MATITLKNVPKALHERLKASAERNRRSMNSEALVCLERALTPHTRRAADEAISEAEALNEHVGKTFPDVTDEARRSSKDSSKDGDRA
jgi:plasmid stability protein